MAAQKAAELSAPRKNQKIKTRMRGRDWVKFVILIVVAIAVLAPIFLVLMNSFKGKAFISTEPFAWPSADSFAGLDNYLGGIEKSTFSQRSAFRCLSRCFPWRLSCCAPLCARGLSSGSRRGIQAFFTCCARFP